jgi:hypothetical protein
MLFFKRKSQLPVSKAAVLAPPVQLAGLVHFLLRRHPSDEGCSITTPAMSADIVTYNKAGVELRPGDRLYLKFVVSASVIEVRARVPMPHEAVARSSKLPCLVLVDVGEREKRLLSNLVDPGRQSVGAEEALRIIRLVQ